MGKTVEFCGQVRLDILENQMQFKQWSENANQECGVDYAAHAKKVITKAIQEELTEKQRTYFVLYYLDGKTISEIANLFGVNKSTVSRTLKTAKTKLARVVRYASPRTLNAHVINRNRRNNQS